MHVYHYSYSNTNKQQMIIFYDLMIIGGTNILTLIEREISHLKTHNLKYSILNTHSTEYTWQTCYMFFALI